MDEPSWVLRAVTYHFASGDALYWGLLLIALAVNGPAWGWAYRHTLLLSAAGVVWIVLSSSSAFVPLSLLIGYLTFWLVVATGRFPRWTPPESERLIVIGFLLILMYAEYRRLHPVLPAYQPGDSLAVVGDSVTAGLNDRDDTWPRQLARRSPIEIYDASQQGATLKSARQQVAALGGRGDLLILEIGGNDLLEGLPVHEFGAQLELLLAEASQHRKHYQSVVMLELPLPPFCQRYGYLQRRISERHGVRLLPKREWLAVLTSAGGTVDGIHLSDAGQSRLAALMQHRLGLPAADVTEPAYVRVDRR